MSRRTRQLFNFGYILVLAALAVNGVITLLNLRTIERSDRWNDHTRQVIIELERAFSTLKDAETGQRGYLLTGDEAYLEPFREASARMRGNLDRLAGLTSDNPSQQVRLAELRRITAAKMEELGKTVTLNRQKGQQAALAVVLTHQGRREMDRARKVVFAMADEEDRLLGLRTRWSRSATLWTAATFSLATCMVIALLGVVFSLKRKEDREQDRAAEALRRSEAWLSTTLESIGDAVISTDERGMVRFLNPVAEGLTGWKSHEARGHPLPEVFRIVSEEDRREVETPVLRVLREGTIVGLDNHTILIAKDGSERPIEDSAAPIRDGGPEIRGIVLTFRDAGDRREAERALKASEERLRLIVESASEFAIFTLDLDGTIATWNSGAARITGYAPHEIVGRAVSALYIPEDVERGVPEQEKERALDFGRAENERWHVRKDGSLFWASGLLMPMREGDRLVGWLKIMRDSTEQKRTEQELELSRERLDLVVNSSEVGLWYSDLPFDKLVWNPKCKEHFGLPADAEVTIDTFFDRLHPDDRGAIREAIERSITGRVDYDVEYRTVGLDGRVRWVRAIGRAFFDVEGAPIRFDGITVDVTQRILQEEALRGADRRKDEFLATLAHELRNPLAPIRNALHLMRDPSARGDGFEADRAMAERQVIHLARLVDDLMDVARISQGKIELRKEVVDLASVVGRAVEGAGAAIRERGHRFTVQLPESPIRLEADPTRLEQVLGNLLTNAAKYTEPGGQIRLSARAEGGEVVLRVSDTGVGIEPEMLPRVFEMFVQVGRHRGYSQGGLGIGLGLVKTLVEMHGGSIAARSDGPGRGSEFILFLPILAGRDGGPADAKPGVGVGEVASPVPRRRVLVVDDNADAANSLARVLARLYGQEVRVAHDGHEAIAEADAFLPEVVLLDIGMPGMDGHEVARRLRLRPDGLSMLIVALTGWGQEGDRQRSRQSGFDRHLVKPVSPEVVRDLLLGMHSSAIA